MQLEFKKSIEIALNIGNVMFSYVKQKNLQY